MRPCFVPFAVFLIVGAAGDAGAATPRRPPRASRLSLVQAQCPGVPPGPCSPAFAFASGTAVLTSAREPGPTCPGGKTPKGGQVRLEGVQKNGAPFTGTLRATATLKTTFTPDAHNGNCELSGVQITIPSLGGDVACRNGRCKGDLVGAGCLPGSCADTFFTTELVSLVVNDDAGQPLATPGTFVPPAKADVP
jgi:hypothetical protein